PLRIVILEQVQARTNRASWRRSGQGPGAPGRSGQDEAGGRGAAGGGARPGGGEGRGAGAGGAGVGTPHGPPQTRRGAGGGAEAAEAAWKGAAGAPGWTEWVRNPVRGEPRSRVIADATQRGKLSRQILANRGIRAQPACTFIRGPRLAGASEACEQVRRERPV